jgi:hypothetical protein
MECALSVGQEALWFINRMAPESAAYNVSFTTRLHTALDVSVFARAVWSTARRHDVLRSVFTEIEGVPKRIVSDSGLFRLDVRDVPGVSEALLTDLVRAEVARPFHLAAESPARLVLLRRAPDDVVLVFAAHHIAMDLPSQVLVLQDLLDTYQALMAGRTPDLVPLTSTYDDFVTAERRLLDSPRAAELVDQWRAVCAGVPTVLNLLTDRPRPTHQRLRGSSHVFQLPEDVVSGLVPASRENRTTPARYLLAVFQCLLHRYAHQADFLLGCAATSTLGLNRQGVAGYFVNSIPVRARFTPTTTFRETVREATGQLREGMARTDLPFALLPRALGLVRATGASPLFQVMVSMVTVNRASPLLALAAGGHGTEVDYAGLTLTAFDVPQQEGQFDLTLELVRDATSIRCALKYDMDLFDRSTVGRLAEHFVLFLRAAAADPDRRVDDVPLVDDTERARILAFATGNPALAFASNGGKP